VGPYNTEKQPGELSTAEVKGILNQIFEAGVLSVTFSGGEPLCRPDIFEIMGHAKQRGLFFGLKTNGTLITEPVAVRLKELGITGIHVSLYGAKPSTHESVTGIPGSYTRTIQAIRLLREQKIRISIKTTIMECNFRELKDMEDVARHLGASFNPDPLVFSKVGQPGSAASIRLDNGQLRNLVVEQNWVPADADITANELERHLICGGGRTRCAISPMGQIFPCAVWRIPLGDLTRQSFKDIWLGEAANKIRAITVNDLPFCTRCDLVGYCARCPGLLHMENGSVSGPSSENCRLADALKGVKNGRKQEGLRKPQDRDRTG
jgi:radical SAM protein with 4Fe4S-binding SPASM domain